MVDQAAITVEAPAHFRQRVVMATLSGRPLRFTNVRHLQDEPGLRDYEVSFLRLVDKVSNGCIIEIDHSGTTVSYRPGVLIGGKVTHDCPTTRAVGYFLEALIWLAPFCKKPVVVTLTGVTNNQEDPCVRLGFCKHAASALLFFYGSYVVFKVFFYVHSLTLFLFNINRSFCRAFYRLIRFAQ